MYIYIYIHVMLMIEESCLHWLRPVRIVMEWSLSGAEYLAAHSSDLIW